MSVYDVLYAQAADAAWMCAQSTVDGSPEAARQWARAWLVLDRMAAAELWGEKYRPAS